MTWKLDELRSHVERLYGSEQLSLLSPCLDSIVHRTHFAKYHLNEAMHLVTKFVDAHHELGVLANLLLGTNDPHFDSAMLNAGAHVVACAASIHATSDTLGHVLYYSLGMNKPQKLQEWKVDLKLVSKRLAQAPQC